MILPTILLAISVLIGIVLNHYQLMSESIHRIVEKVILIITIFSISWILISLVHLLKLSVLSKYDVSKQDNLQSRRIHTQYNVLERIVIVIIMLFAIGIVLLSFDSLRNVGLSLFASAGVAGLIIGLAAQKVIGGLLAGIQIAITQPIRLDDVVIVENEWGWIEEINLTYVVVRIWDKRRLIVPSTYFIEKPFQNWTRTTAEILGTVFIYTDYTLPLEALRKELTRLLEASSYWDGNVNVVQVTDAKERTVEIRALMSAKDSPTAWNLRVHIREKLIEFIKNNYPECLPRTRIDVSEPRVGEKKE
jgi:small-conductance mechanosensitive channel